MFNRARKSNINFSPRPGAYLQANSPPQCGFGDLAQISVRSQVHDDHFRKAKNHHRYFTGEVDILLNLLKYFLVSRNHWFVEARA
jgi:hypothetical protein